MRHFTQRTAMKSRRAVVSCSISQESSLESRSCCGKRSVLCCTWYWISSWHLSGLSSSSRNPLDDDATAADDWQATSPFRIGGGVGVVGVGDPEVKLACLFSPLLLLLWLMILLLLLWIRSKPWLGGVMASLRLCCDVWRGMGDPEEAARLWESVSVGAGEMLPALSGGDADGEGVSVSTFTRGLSLPRLRPPSPPPLRDPMLEMDCTELLGEGEE